MAIEAHERFGIARVVEILHNKEEQLERQTRQLRSLEIRRDLQVRIAHHDKSINLKGPIS
jgi:hypothetical protein